ncbi:hypothetical protein BJ742DRAFT_826576 [Cladochytrium replicatum]|nr:hypothetical protein BJ742DRAFT_826576 [Cladochytrium replicatum]
MDTLRRRSPTPNGESVLPGVQIEDANQHSSLQGSDGPAGSAASVPTRTPSGISPLPKISRACDQCITKKTRCSGSQPCGACTERGRPCTFNLLPGRPGRPRKSDAAKAASAETIAAASGMHGRPRSNTSSSTGGKDDDSNHPVFPPGARQYESWAYHYAAGTHLDGSPPQGRAFRNDRHSAQLGGSNYPAYSYTPSNSLPIPVRDFPVSSTRSHRDQDPYYYPYDNYGQPPAQRDFWPEHVSEQFRDSPHSANSRRPQPPPLRFWDSLNDSRAYEGSRNRYSGPSSSETPPRWSEGERLLAPPQAHATAAASPHRLPSLTTLGPLSRRPSDMDGREVPVIEPSEGRLAAEWRPNERQVQRNEQQRQLWGFQHQPLPPSSNRELAFDDDLPALPDWAVQNLLIQNGVKLLGAWIPSFDPTRFDHRGCPPVIQWSLQAAAFPFCSSQLESMQRGLSSPSNVMFPLLERVRRSLSRLIDPYRPNTMVRGISTAVFATVTPSMWSDFFAIDRHVMKAVLGICVSLWFFGNRGSATDQIHPPPRDSAGSTKDTSIIWKSQSRIWLSMVVDYGMRLGLHQNLRPPETTGNNQADEQRIFDEMDERRTLWWSLFVFERAFFPLDEPAIGITQGKSLPIAQLRDESRNIPMRFGTLLRLFDSVPDYDSKLIAPLPSQVVYDATTAGRTKWRALRGRIYRMCVKDEKSKRVCERLRQWAPCAAITLHINAVAATLARESALRDGEWWTIEGTEEQATWDRAMEEGKSGDFTNDIEMSDFDDNIGELEADNVDMSATREQAMRVKERRKGALRLARLRKLTRSIETVFAYNESVYYDNENVTRGGQDPDQIDWRPSDGQGSDTNAHGKTTPAFFWDTPDWHTHLRVYPFLSIPSILVISHSPSSILESLVRARTESCDEGRPIRGVCNALRDRAAYIMLVRWVRSRFGGQLCWMQGRTLLRRLNGIMASIEGYYTRNTDVWSTSSSSVQSLSQLNQFRLGSNGNGVITVDQAMSMNAHAVVIVWRAVAMSIVAWGLWEELGESEGALLGSASGVAGEDIEGPDEEEAVRVETSRLELVKGADTVLSWISKTLSFCGSNGVYLEALKAIRDLVL